jgi:diguanylate cyclase (GGDEF)-like protein
VDIRTLFLAQTCALAAIAAMLWVARSAADRANGLRTWMAAVAAQALAYLLLANQSGYAVLAATLLGNALGALSVVFFFVALRQFLAMAITLRTRLLLAALVIAVAAVAAATGAGLVDAIWPTIFNGVVYGSLQLLNARALWRARKPELLRVQHVVALMYLGMGLLLPLRAAALLLSLRHPELLQNPAAWNQPIYLFGFLFIIVTNLGFLQMCKIRAEAEVRMQALTDGLTALPNRRALDEALADALQLAQRKAQAFSVLMIDLDFFKAINDRFGHHTGDEVLAGFAQQLRAGLRAQDQAFRYGGEEFIALLPDTDAPAALALAERLRQAVASPGDAGRPAISASFGVAVWRAGDVADSIFQRADRALYQAKSSGRDRVELG